MLVILFKLFNFWGGLSSPLIGLDISLPVAELNFQGALLITGMDSMWPHFMGSGDARKPE